MATNPPIPSTNELSKQLWDVATTLTPEAQNAGLKKATELGFDLNRGKIPLAETLINLDNARSTLLDVVQKNKLSQLPLKLQYLLFAQSQRVSQNLLALVAGSDTVQAIEDAVDDLTSSIWQYNLQNLSGEVLGFAEKMNQLKRQETLIREAHRQAESFSNSRIKAEDIVFRLSELDAIAKSLSSAIEQMSSTSETLLGKITMDVESARTALGEIENQKALASEEAEACKAAAGTTAELVQELQVFKKNGDDTVRKLDELLDSASTQLDEAKVALDKVSQQLTDNIEALGTSLKHEAGEVNETLSQSVSEFREMTKLVLDEAIDQLQSSVAANEQSITDLVSNTEAQLKQSEKAQTIAMDGSIKQFERLRGVKFDEIEAEFLRILFETEEKGNASLAKNDAEVLRLTTELESLEARIRESINRATGYTLFHSFQKRQEDLSQAKLFWARALGGCVLASLIASALFIWGLQYVHEYNAAFYLKLSISLPLIYAIAFCNLQYSKERNLEEEYAFKSSISISLDPYQRLVRSVVSEGKPDEMAKYTAFLIESVNRVFTPPSVHNAAESEGKSGELVETILKSVGKFCEPFLSAVKK